MKTCLIWIAILLILFMPFSAYGGTIQTSITTSQTVTDQGDIELKASIHNSGDATAHNVSALFILAELVKGYDQLGDNPPGGDIRLKETLVHAGLNPGKYVAVMRVNFEEQTGNPHQAYHFFDIWYRMERMPSSNLALSMKTTDPCLNKKAFWDRNGILRLSIKNDGDEEIHLNAWLFLPEGFSSPEPNRAFRLTPGETKVEEIPVSLDPGGSNLKPYHLIVWCDHDHAHHSWDLKGVIKVEDQPVYFKGYLISGSILSVILFVALAIRNRRGMNSRRMASHGSAIENHQSTIDNL